MRLFKSTPLFLLFIAIAVQGIAQKKDTLVYYFNAALQRVKDKDEASFGGLMIRHDKTSWTLYVFYPDGKRMLIGNFRDKKLKTRQGQFVTFYHNGNKSAYSNFNNNILDQLWQSWYENGQPKDSGAYDQGLKNGRWKTWYATGQQESAGQYAVNRKTGDWWWYRENGLPATHEVYNNDSLENLTCYDNEGRPNGIACSIDMQPVFPGGEDSLNRFIVDNLYYPDEAVNNRIEGKVAFGFWVKKDGSIGDIVIESSPSSILSNEVKRMLHTMPKWEPAISHNREVDYYEKMELPFYLNQ